MKKRDLYLEKLIMFKDKPVIKVITGMRRTGKSSLLELYYQYLIDSGVREESIIKMNFESFEYDNIKNYKELYLAIKGKADKSKKVYIMLDEIQQVSLWEKAVNSFRVDFDADIYITGSNAYLLSSEMSTLLSGRYVEIKMLPLSFKEYLDFRDYKKSEQISDYFEQYLQYGGIPAIVDFLDYHDTIRTFLSGIYNTVIVKDIIQRNQVRDGALLENIVKYLIENIGNPVSTKKISDYLTSTGRKTTPDTVDNYLDMLESAYILYKAERYDLKGKMRLKTLSKYYVVDTGIRNELLGFGNMDYGRILENIVYFELLRKGYRVSIGKVGSFEVDFVAEKPDKVLYCQVAASIMDEDTRKRELRPLLEIKDNYEKIVLTMDKTFITDYQGIKVINIIDFLLGLM